MLRTHNCNELNATSIGQKVTLCGWIETVRDHGGVLFVDLRDHYGVTQIVFFRRHDARRHHQGNRSQDRGRGHEA